MRTVPPGGSVDTIARLFRAQWPEGLGKPIMIDTMTMQAAPDRVVSDPDVRAEIEDQGCDAQAGSAACGAFPAMEIETWGRMIGDKRITADA